MIGLFEKEVLLQTKILYVHAYRLTRHRCDAEDLVQEVLLCAFRKIGSYRSGSNCKAWLLCILLNLHSNAAKKFRPHFKDYETALRLDIAPQEPRHFRNENHLYRCAFSDEVRAALLDLPSVFKEAVLFRDLWDLSYSEISKIMDCSESTIATRIYRGRRLLRKALEDCND